jgi:hypothetical protein
MKRILIALSAIIVLVISVSGCTLEDETVEIKITDTVVLETGSATEPFIGIVNFTVINDQSGKIRVNETNFKLTGQNILAHGTKPKLHIRSFTLHDNGTGTIKSGKKQDITITHTLHENTVLLVLDYEYDDIEISLNLSKKQEADVVVTPSFFSTNYFLLIIVLVFGLGIAVIFLGKSEDAPKRGKHECRFCLKDLSKAGEGGKIYCQKWKTRTKRCGEGPFCSQEHLDYHWEDVEHEN